jgi:UDP-2-acetamido-3-amino-2,3-dideoxy-glucuronate N-acetyltransferase
MGRLNLVNGVKIHETAEVDDRSQIGEGTFIWNNVQVREWVKIGRNCILNKDVYIDLEVSIGDRVKIQNGVSVYKGVTIEDDVFLGPHMVLTNDLFPRAFLRDWKISPTLIKKGASIGANATIICGITIGEYALVGAGCVVNRDVPPHALMVGNPARKIGYVCKCGHPLKNIVPASSTTCGQCHEEFPAGYFNESK